MSKPAGEAGSLAEPLADEVLTGTLCQSLGLTFSVARWLVRRGHQDPDRVAAFLDPKLADLSSPDAMADRKAAAERISAAIRQRQTVVVFGDYDCDGITSAAIMTEVIRALGGVAEPLLASRFDGGYGVSPNAVHRILGKQPALLITCDCGSSDHATLRQIVERDVDVVVIDHHLVPDEPLPALAFLNPHRPECGFPYKGLASCGLALSMAAALRKELGLRLDIRRWLDLVAIGTIADVAPLDDDNRALVRAGLSRLATTERPGLRALFGQVKLDLSLPISGRDVAFRIAPLINGPGRLGPPDVALTVLLEQDERRAGELAATLIGISTERRALQERMIEEASQQIESEGYGEQSAIVVGSPEWNSGIAGIAAGRLVDRWQRPVIVLGVEGELARGSVRGPAGSRLHDALSRVQDCLIRFGGHQVAAGVELELARLSEFRERFVAAVSECGPAPVASGHGLELLMDVRDDPRRVLADLDRLEPCGEGNPRPRLVVEGKVRVAREVTGGHLKLELETESGAALGGFGVNMGALARDLGGRVRVTGDLRHNSYPGSPPVELFVEQVNGAGPAPRK